MSPFMRGGGIAAYRFATIAGITGGALAFSLMLREDAAPQQAIGPFSTGWRLKVMATWANHVLSFSNGGGNGVIAPVQALTSGWNRLNAVATSIVPADAHTFRVYPAGGAGDASGGAVLYGAQAENGLFCTSYIPTVGAAATRAQTTVSILGALPVGIHATRYEHYWDQATGVEVERVVDVPSTVADVSFDRSRVWYALAYGVGVKTLAEMQELVQ